LTVLGRRFRRHQAVLTSRDGDDIELYLNFARIRTRLT